jgi:hypothetical protein
MRASDLLSIVALHGAVAATQYGPAHLSRDRKVCEVAASGTNATDDAPAILAAFDECGQGGTVLFTENTTYYVNTVMEVAGLQDCHVDIRGTLLVSRGHLSHLSACVWEATGPLIVQ